MTYTLNGRGEPLGDAKASERPAPRSRVGVLLNHRTHDRNRTDRNDHWIRRDRDWYDHFRETIDPISHWLEGDGLHRSAIYDFEGPWGHAHDYRRYFAVDEMLRNERYGQPWRNEGLIECCRLYVDGGAEVVIHTGCPDAADFAKRLIDQDCPRASYELLATLYRVHAPLVEAGIRIGHDAAGFYGDASTTYRWFKFLDTIGAKQQIEASPSLKQRHWKGATVRLSWSQFQRMHVEQDANTKGVHALAGTPEFVAWHPDLRVHVRYDSFGADVSGWEQDKAVRAMWLHTLAEGTRGLLAKYPNVTVLLDDWPLRVAIEEGIAVEAFLPEVTR